MRPLNVLIAGGLASLTAMSAHAQTPEPSTHHYRCRAECYAIGADGVTLTYAGGETVYGTSSRGRTFQKLQPFCPYPHLMVRRDLTGITSETRSRPVTLTHYTWNQGYRWNSRRERVTTYTITDTETRARFTTEAATEANSCQEIPADEMPPFESIDGERVFG